MPEPFERALEDFHPADSYEFQPAFRQEREMEDFVLKYLLDEGFARLPRPIDGLGLNGRQDRLGPAMRTDLLLPACEPWEGQPTLGLVELKIWAGGVAVVSQALRYRTELKRRYPAWRITAHVVAQGFSEAVIKAATEEDVLCWEVREDGDRLILETLNAENGDDQGAY